MDRQILIVFVALFGAGAILMANTPLLGVHQPVSEVKSFRERIPLTINPFFKLTLFDDALITTQAWTTFQNYLEFAKTHNLTGIRSLSHQISDTCNDPLRESECFALMDSVYSFASEFEASEFKHLQADDKQILLYTDGPVRAILFFTRDTSKIPKILGLQFCEELEFAIDSCIETDPEKRDLDHNGWWDNVEALFYK
jgi:hypothetical protein